MVLNSDAGEGVWLWVVKVLLFFMGVISYNEGREYAFL